MKNNYYYFIMLFIILSFLNINPSIGQGLYINENGLNLFPVSEEKDLKIITHIPVQLQGFLIGSVYSPMERLSVSLGYFRVNHETDDGSRNGNLFTGSVGTYRTFNKVSKRDEKPSEIVLSAQLGYSYGKINTIVNSGYINLNFGKPFVQIGSSFQMENWGVGVRLKYNRLRFYSGESGLLDLDSKSFKRSERLANEAFFDTMEINYQINIGKGVIVCFLGKNLELRVKKSTPNFLSSNHVFVGLLYDFGKQKKKRNKK